MKRTSAWLFFLGLFAHILVSICIKVLKCDIFSRFTFLQYCLVLQIEKRQFCPTMLTDGVQKIQLYRISDKLLHLVLYELYRLVSYV